MCHPLLAGFAGDKHHLHAARGAMIPSKAGARPGQASEDATPNRLGTLGRRLRPFQPSETTRSLPFQAADRKDTLARGLGSGIGLLFVVSP